jgi:hypothetical protein
MTNDPQTTAWLDQEDTHIAHLIRAHRWVVQYVGAGDAPDEPAFGYTIGLFGLGHPELVVVGLDHHPTHDLLRLSADLVTGGRDLLPGELVHVDGRDPVVVEPVPNPGEVVLGANRHYLRPPEFSVAAFQLTWSRAGGVFPWDPGWGGEWRQPRPGSWRA